MPSHLVSSVNRGQGSQSVCPLMVTHLGCQTVPGFVYLLSLTISAQSRTRTFCPSQTRLTFARATKREFTLTLEPEHDRKSDITHARNDMLITAAKPRGCSAEENLFGCKKKKKNLSCVISLAGTQKRPNLNGLPNLH